MELRISINESDIKKNAEDHIKDKIKTSYNRQVYDFFREGFKDHSGIEIHPTGVGLAMINKLIEDKFMASMNDEKIKSFIDAKFDEIFERCMEQAIEHQIRKASFTQTTEKAKEKLENKNL